jgi:hypothetical protein
MTRSAAAKASAAADALLDFLRTQPRVPQQHIPPDAAPDPRGADAPPCADAVLPPADVTRPDAPADARPRPGPAPDPPAPPRPETTSRDAPQRLAHTDWLHHRLTITGPAAALAGFRAAAAGGGIIPWQLDRDRIAEDFFHLLAAPPAPQQRSLSLAGARVVAGQLGDAVARRHDMAVSLVGDSRACPFDLHKLVPVPEKILRLGPDDPVSVRWLWEYWGTTRELRHVTAEIAAPDASRQHRPAAGGGEIRVRFWSADWSPSRALAAIAGDFPALRFALRPSYDPP